MPDGVPEPVAEQRPRLPGRSEVIRATLSHGSLYLLHGLLHPAGGLQAG